MNLMAKALLAFVSATTNPVVPDLSCRATGHLFLDNGDGTYSYKEFCATSIQYVVTSNQGAHLYIEANMGTADLIFKNGFES